jgi:transcriptional regulator with XRE-family HTH domain
MARDITTLKLKRLCANISQAELGQRSEIGRERLNRAERGKVKLSEEELQLLTDTLFAILKAKAEATLKALRDET